MEFLRKNIFLAIIILFHVIGLIGFIISPEQFTSLSYVNLLLSVGLILYQAKNSSIKFYISLLSIAIIGFFAEVIGVKTALIFGNYEYGDAFGYKIFEVPLMIGLNWAILAYSTLQIVNFKSRIANAFSASFLMVFLDFFIEQNAEKYDFWYWADSQIPLKNYQDWFIVAFILTVAFEPILKPKENKLSKQFYFIQVLFFVILLIYSKLL
jgi:uncharacterized membrane protein